MKQYAAIKQRGITTEFIGDPIFAYALTEAEIIAEGRGYDFDEVLTFVKTVEF